MEDTYTVFNSREGVVTHFSDLVPTGVVRSDLPDHVYRVSTTFSSFRTFLVRHTHPIHHSIQKTSFNQHPTRNLCSILQGEHSLRLLTLGLRVSVPSSFILHITPSRFPSKFSQLLGPYLYVTTYDRRPLQGVDALKTLRTSEDGLVSRSPRGTGSTF